jgi:NADPH:quinone reductase-like Zn-dependent oxidoreductase
MLTSRRTRTTRSNGAMAGAPGRSEPDLLGQTVVVLGGTAGVGLEVARGARAAGADVILTGGDPEWLERAALEVGARNTAAFDAGDLVALKRFFDGLTVPIDHVLVAPTLAAGDPDAVALAVARNAAGRIRPDGTLLLANGVERSFAKALAVALAPVRVRVERIRETPDDDDDAALAVHAMENTTLGGAGYDSPRLAEAV